MAEQTRIQLLRGTLSQVLSETAIDGRQAFATDTQEVYIGEGGFWYLVGKPLMGVAISRPITPQAGAVPGKLYFATDTKVLSIYQNSEWHNLTGPDMPIDSTQFEKHLSVDDNTVQKALETLDGLELDGRVVWSVYSTNQTAKNNTGYAFDTRTADRTLTLPVDPETGFIFGVKDAYGSASVNNIIVNRNGKKIEGEEENVLIDIDTAAMTFAYINEDRGWVQVSEAAGGGVGGPNTTIDGSVALWNGTDGRSLKSLDFGNPNEILSVNSSGDGVEWTDRSVDGGTLD